MGEGDTVTQWLHDFISGTYLTSDCDCGSGRPCRSFFSVVCSVDHLCRKQFETPGGGHFGHDKLQVRKGSRRCAVIDTDLKAYMDTKLVQKFNINDEENCFLSAKERSGPRSSASIKEACCERAKHVEVLFSLERHRVRSALWDVLGGEFHLKALKTTRRIFLQVLRTSRTSKKVNGNCTVVTTSLRTLLLFSWSGFD